MLSIGINACGITPSDYDPCLFMGDHIICMLYADDCLLFSKKDKYIDALVEKSFEQKFSTYQYFTLGQTRRDSRRTS